MRKCERGDAFILLYAHAPDAGGLVLAGFEVPLAAGAYQNHRDGRLVDRASVYVPLLLRLFSYRFICHEIIR